MYIKNNTLYANPYYILVGNKVAFQIEDAIMADYKEQKINMDDIVVMKHKKYTVVRVGGVLNIKMVEFTKKWLKTAIVEKRYDNDDQIAIILNKDIDEEHLKDYHLMQEWRKFADDLSNAVLKQCGIFD